VDDDAPRFVTLDATSVDEHHLCCALGDPKHEAGVARKRAWLKERFAEGLVFRKLDVRGKVFIEYAPGEVAWRPVVAPGWFVVHCLWVSGRYAGQGYATALVDDALDHAARTGRHGLVIASGATKRPFLSDPAWLTRHGFTAVDRAGQWRLWARPVGGEMPDGVAPRLADSVHEAVSTGPAASSAAPGRFVARYDDQCPFNEHWSQEVVASLQRRGQDAVRVHVDTCVEAQRSPSPLGTYGLERDGRLVCLHLTTDAATGRLLDALAEPR
jgi:GNAT superfamily N-acetyltransferase